MKTILLIFTVLITTSLTALASVPQEHSSCTSMPQISEPQGSQGYYIGDDCKTIYILPPTEGQIKVSSLTAPDSLATCKAITADVTALSTEVNVLNNAMNERAALDQTIADDRAACADIHGRQKALQDLVTAVKSKIASLQSDLQTQQTLKTQCKAESQARGCDSVDDRIEAINGHVADENSRLSDLNDKEDGVMDRVASCEAKHPHSKEDNNTDVTQLSQMQAQIDDMTKKITAERGRLSSIPGGEASLTFSSQNAALLAAFKDQNSSSRLNFVMMPLKKAQIFFERVRNGKDAGLASVLRFNIFGATENSNSGPQTIDGNTDIAADDAARLFGGAVGAQISLNLYAACLLHQTYGDLSSEKVKSALASLIRPTVNFEYELQAAKSIKVNYNQSYLYSLIRQHTSSGGFFWTSSSDSITEKTVANQWLTIVESSDDGDLTWEKSEDRLFQLRREVLDAALAYVTKKSYITPGDAIADGGTPPKNGAATAADGLHKYPNPYCQAVALVLDVANAIFAGSSSTGSVTKTVETSQIENLEIQGMIRFAGSQTFTYGNE